jgi:hypothetical protein
MDAVVRMYTADVSGVSVTLVTPARLGRSLALPGSRSAAGMASSEACVDELPLLVVVDL